MRPCVSPAVVVLCGAGCLSVSRAGPPRSQEAPERPIALVGGTIYTSPDEEPIRGGVILVRDGKIAAVDRAASLEVPPEAERIDCSGLTVTAGFWNSHVHFSERKWADAGSIPAPELARQLRDVLARYGFTSAFDTGSPWANTRRIRDRIESGEVPGPRIRSTGEPLVAQGAMPSERILAVLGWMAFPAPEITDEAGAAAACRELLEQGVDGIKVHLQPPPRPHPRFPPDAVRTVVAAARRSGKPVFVHPDGGADVLAAIQAGVDVVLHTTPRSGPWDEALLAAVREHDVALTPTLGLWKSFLRHDRVSVQERQVETAVGQLRAWVEAGGAVLFGTDLGAVDDDPAEEYALMARAGMGFGEILASLTSAPAERFGESDRLGRIAPGLLADLVVLEGDPARDLRALGRVRYTLRAGRVLYRGGE